MHPLPEADRTFLQAVAELPYCNPFLPERVEAERRALGREFTDRGPVWTRPLEEGDHPNVRRIGERLELLLPPWLERQQRGGAGEEERRLYADVVRYWLYYRYQEDLRDLILAPPGERARRVPFYPRFAADAERTLFDPALSLPVAGAPEQLFAWFYQVRRAFHSIFHAIIGRSMASARLRAASWQSVFSHDMRRFLRGLYQRMDDMTTLITGPSGTGKELVARAIGMSRHVTFDPASQTFADDPRRTFFPLNLSALSPTQLESELFGHQRGSFTGAVRDREGWFEVCPAHGAVFLDEVGEIEPAIQVKLLRVLETRTFQRLGDTQDRKFAGKLIAATNRDLAEELSAGRLREDFFDRLCADRIRTPSLREQLGDDPDELSHLVRAAAQRLVGAEEAEPLAADTLAAIDRSLGPDYPWPGNFRELEQCIRNVMIRGSYLPERARSVGGADPVLDQVAAGSLGAEELLDGYTARVYQRSGSYVATAERIGLDRRTVKARVERWRARGGEPAPTERAGR